MNKHLHQIKTTVTLENGGKTRFVTKEQEANEIIKRLSTPPPPKKNIYDILVDIMAQEIQKEIDAEIRNKYLNDAKLWTLKK
jgi:hypothetical protein